MVQSWTPSIEVAKFRKIDFAPAEAALAHTGTICLGTPKRSLGDALRLTPLPELLKTRYPHLKIRIYPGGFNPVVFAGNPHVAGISLLPRKVYSDAASLGIAAEFPAQARIYLTPGETRRAEELIRRSLLPRNEGKPLCLIHPWSSATLDLAEARFWDELVERWRHRCRFWQVGLDGHAVINGCEYYLLLPPAPRWVRLLLAVTTQAKVFLGSESAPLLAARTVGIPNLAVKDYRLSAETADRFLAKHFPEITS